MLANTPNSSSHSSTSCCHYHSVLATQSPRLSMLQPSRQVLQCYTTDIPRLDQPRAARLTQTANRRATPCTPPLLAASIRCVARRIDRAYLGNAANRCHRLCRACVPSVGTHHSRPTAMAADEYSRLSDTGATGTGRQIIHTHPLGQVVSRPSSPSHATPAHQRLASFDISIAAETRTVVANSDRRNSVGIANTAGYHHVCAQATADVLVAMLRVLRW
jgi:hypothetical protein